MKRLITLIFIALLFLPLLQLTTGIVDESKFGVEERRTLAAIPDLSESSLFEIPDTIERYFSDNFGFRSLLIKVANSMRFHLFGISPHDRVLVGQDGWLFHGGGNFTDLFQGRDLLSDDLLATLRGIYRARSEFLEFLGIDYHIVITPSKETIYPDYYDPRLPKISDQTAADNFIAKVSEPLNIEVIDLRTPLHLARKESSEPLYLASDSHWNDLGAYHGYRSLIEELSTSYPELEALTLSSYRFEQREFTRGLGGILGVFNPPTTTYKAILPDPPDRALARARQERLRQRRAQGTTAIPVIVRRNKQRAGVVLDSVMVYRDSFFNRMMKFFSRHFRRGYYYPIPAVTFDPETIWIKRPQLVIDQFSDTNIFIPHQRWWRLMEMGSLHKQFKKLRQTVELMTRSWTVIKKNGSKLAITNKTRIPTSSVQIKSQLDLSEGMNLSIIKIDLVSEEEAEVSIQVKAVGAEDTQMRFPVAADHNTYFVEIPEVASSLTLSLTIEGTETVELFPVEVI